jgi:hypothetical protein
VREESLTLYGFTDEDERAIFEGVQTVSGVVHLEQGKFVTVLVRQTGSGGPLDVSLTTFDMAYVGI